MNSQINTLCMFALLTGCATFSQDDLPAISTDGLERVSNKSLDVLYVRPSIDFSRYETVFVTTPAVEFDADWQRRQNSTDPYRVTDKDLETIKQMVRDDVVDVFRKELSESTNYTIVDSVAEASLILTPKIINLDIINPLNNQSYRITVFADNSGSMTLEIELEETKSAKVLIRLKDRSRGYDHTNFHRQSSVLVRYENRRVLRRWARSLNDVINQDISSG